MSEEEFSNWQKKLLVAVLVAILGGNTLGFLNMRNPDVRSDPFTGTQGKDLVQAIEKMEQRLDRIDSEQVKMIWRMGQVEKSCNLSTEKLQEHFRRHP